MFRGTVDNVCPGCHGSGAQYRKDTGLTVRCPICLGSGKKDLPNPFGR